MMVWAVSETVKLCSTIAAAYVSSPACAAWMVQVPAPKKVTTLPDTVHTAGVIELKVTGRPELAVAVSVIGTAADCGPGLGNVIVCGVVPPAKPLPVTVTTAVLPV